MSETKLCPTRKEVSIQTLGEADGPVLGHTEDFLLCIQEKCAWWVEEKEVYFSGGALVSGGTITVPGHCVALDWGKK